MQALEAEIVIFLAMIQVLGVDVLLFENFSLLDLLALAVDKVADLLPVLQSTDDGVALCIFFELFEINLVDFVSLLGLLDKNLHLGPLVDLRLVFGHAPVPFVDEFSVDLECIELDDGLVFLLDLAHFTLIVLVGPERQDDEHEEQCEGHDGLPQLNLLIAKEQEHQDVG